MKSRCLLPATVLRSVLIGASFTCAGTLCAQNSAAWFDATDWFDGQKIKAAQANGYGVYDFDYNYGLGDNFDYAEWSTYDRWSDDSYDNNFWDRNDWAESTARIGKPVGGTQSFSIYGERPAKTRSSEDTKAERSSNKSERSKPLSSPDGRKQVAHLEGTIEGLRTMQLRRESGAMATYAIAKVRLGKDKHTIVNLGREAQVKDLALKKGDSIEAIGRRGLIGDKDVFVAHRLKAGNRTIDANPTIRLSSENQQTVTGTVTDIKTAGKPPHTLVELKLENGKSSTIDLGPAAAVEKIDLQTSERVTVRGQSKDQDDRTVIIPDLLKIEGESAASK